MDFMQIPKFVSSRKRVYNSFLLDATDDQRSVDSIKTTVSCAIQDAHSDYAFIDEALSSSSPLPLAILKELTELRKMIDSVLSQMLAVIELRRFVDE